VDFTHYIYTMWRASPVMVANLAIQKVQLSTLATAFSLHTPTNLLFYNLLLNIISHSFFYYIFFANTQSKRKQTYI
jgi:hypothetical protein